MFRQQISIAKFFKAATPIVLLIVIKKKVIKNNGQNTAFM